METQNIYYELNDVVLSFEDYKEFSKSTSTSTLIKVWRVIGAAYIGLFGLVLILLHQFSGLGGAGTEVSNSDISDLISRLSVFLFMVFVLFIVPWFIYPIIINRLRKKAYHSNAFIQRPQKYEFNDTGFKVTTLNGQNSFYWNEVKEVKETKHYLALYLSKYHVFVIPRKYLEGGFDLINHIRKKVYSRYSIIKGGLIVQ